MVQNCTLVLQILKGLKPSEHSIEGPKNIEPPHALPIPPPYSLSIHLGQQSQYFRSVSSIALRYPTFLPRADNRSNAKASAPKAKLSSTCTQLEHPRVCAQEREPTALILQICKRDIIMFTTLDHCTAIYASTSPS